MSILKILEDINSDTKKSHKLAVVKQHKDNATFLKVLKLALDPYVNFYVRKIPIYTPNNTQSLDWALLELDKLSSRQLTGHAGIEHLRNILSSLSVDDATVVERVIGKDLRAGFAENTVNDAIPNHISTYPCLLAKGYDSKSIKKMKWPALSQKKGDGLRLNAIVVDSKVTLCGRSGREIDILGEMDAHFLNLGKMYGQDCVFDGEMVVVDSNNKVLPRRTSNGILNKAIKGTISITEAKQVRVMLWDVIPFSEFKKEVSSEIYSVRFKNVCKVVEENTVNSNLSWIIETLEVNSLEEAIAHFNEMLNMGCEGTVLKNKAGLWENKRSGNLIKFKSEKMADLMIESFNPGEGKFTGMVGSLNCVSSDRKVQVAISGFSDDLRREITNTIDELINNRTIVEIEYNERISSESSHRVGVDSLFLPRFSMFRFDRTEANSSDEIK